MNSSSGSTHVIWYYLGLKDYETLMYDKFYDKDKFNQDILHQRPELMD